MDLCPDTRTDNAQQAKHRPPHREGIQKLTFGKRATVKERFKGSIGNEALPFGWA
jgi:hypothetical protein